MLEGVGIQGYAIPAGKKKEDGRAANARRRNRPAAGTQGSEVDDHVSRRSFRSSREPSAANRSTCAWCHSLAGRSNGKFEGADGRHARNCSRPCSKTAEALATAIVQ